MNRKYEGDLDAEKFYDLAMLPGFPDEMSFALDANELHADTFSMDGVNKLFEQMRNFALARLVAYGDATGNVARRAHIRLKIEFFEEGEPYLPMKMQPHPFYEAFERGDAKAIEVDGLRRSPPLDKPFD